MADNTSRRYTGRQRSYNGGKGFAAEVDDIIGKVDERMTLVLRQSIQDVILNANQAKAKGGRMPVDTGFLRASGAISYTGMPSGPSRGELTAKDSYAFNEVSIQTDLAKLKVGDTVWFGWTAAYARYQELYNGFLEGALQQWGRIVAFNADDAMRRIK